jgi:hypothetical protein
MLKQRRAPIANKVMIRPLKALNLLHRKMGEMLAVLQ